MLPIPTMRQPSRRRFLQAASCGFGSLAFTGMLQAEGERVAPSPLAPKPPHFPARAKRVIFLNMQGGPTAQETFDYKPGTSHFAFHRHGQSGLWISELFPHLAKHADKLCVLQGMHTNSPVHNAASIQLHTGNFQFARPSMGSWVLYGLGTENQNLPGFIALAPTAQWGGPKLYDSAFLPSTYQGSPFGSGRSLGRESATNTNGSQFHRSEMRRILDRLQERNQGRLAADEHDPRLNGLIQSYELAFRMQDHLPNVLDWSQESKSTIREYGIRSGAPTENFGRQCLVARRLAEAGVRFVELYHANWDDHTDLFGELPRHCREVDQPIAALLGDLAQRGLLEDTLVLWGGEFGRTPTVNGNFNTRRGGQTDHNIQGYTMWMAGGGTKAGYAYGKKDDKGLKAVEGRCHLHDLHATMLHLLGLDHEKLTYRYAGRDFRLTDIHGSVVTEILT